MIDELGLEREVETRVTTRLFITREQLQDILIKHCGLYRSTSDIISMKIDENQDIHFTHSSISETD